MVWKNRPIHKDLIDTAAKVSRNLFFYINQYRMVTCKSSCIKLEVNRKYIIITRNTCVQQPLAMSVLLDFSIQ